MFARARAAAAPHAIRTIAACCAVLGWCTLAGCGNAPGSAPDDEPGAVGVEGPTMATEAGLGAASPVDVGDVDIASGAFSTPAIHNKSGWQIYPAGGYHYGPSIIIDANKHVHMWTCSQGSGGAWDFIRYHASADGGHTWSPDVVALQPTPNSLDVYSTCDPGAVRVGKYWYVGYTSTTNHNGTQNQVFVARSTAPGGPFEKWDGSGWGGAPQPIIPYPGNPAYYGFGEPSLVLLGKKLFVYYTDFEAELNTSLATVDDATVDDWPKHLVHHGHAIARTRPYQDSADVKYVDQLGVFLAVTTYLRMSANATVAVYQSSDGLAFTPVPFRGARVQIGAHNIGISGDRSGHLQLTDANFISYAYQPLGDGWAHWPTFLDPISISSAPVGTPVAGGVSSIPGGDDWSWSGPRAWDGLPGTVYSSDSHGATDSAVEWAKVDVGAELPIEGVTLVPRPGGFGFPVDFAIQVSADGKAWADVGGQHHVGFPNPGGKKVKLTFGSPVTAQYLRVRATRLGADNLGDHYLQLAEIEPHVAQ